MHQPDIFESPDGGHTVYVRQMGSSDRRLYSMSARKQAELQQEKQWELWRDILAKSQQDAVLKDMLDRVEVYHALKNSP
jgi:hypothetical protein